MKVTSKYVQLNKMLWKLVNNVQGFTYFPILCSIIQFKQYVNRA